MLSFTDLAVSKSEAAAYTGAAGIAVSLQETDLMRGQRYIGAQYNSRWRTPFGGDSIPEAVKYAIIEAAVLEARKPGILSPVSTPATDKVLVAVKGIQWERIAASSGPDAYVPRSAIIDGLLQGLLHATASSVAFLERS